jgi:hypothetical protein
LKQSTGLTLTVADHVLLLDSADEANEAQAIGRAYRIGQQKSTKIIRYGGGWRVEGREWQVEGGRKGVAGGEGARKGEKEGGWREGVRDEAYL